MRFLTALQNELYLHRAWTWKRKSTSEQRREGGKEKITQKTNKPRLPLISPNYCLSQKDCIYIYCKYLMIFSWVLHLILLESPFCFCQMASLFFFFVIFCEERLLWYWQDLQWDCNQKHSKIIISRGFPWKLQSKEAKFKNNNMQAQQHNLYLKFQNTKMDFVK